MLTFLLLGTTEEATRNPKGIYNEFFPWVEEYCSDEIKYFYRVDNSQSDKPLDLLRSKYLSVFSAIRADNGANSHTFIPGQYNAIVATAERVKNPRKRLLEDIQQYMQSEKELVDFLFRDKYGGDSLRTILAKAEKKKKKSSSFGVIFPTGGAQRDPDAMDIDEQPPFLQLSRTNFFNLPALAKNEQELEAFGGLSKETIQHFNELLEIFGEKSTALHEFEMRICHFMEKRVLTTRNKKPLTSAISELVKWVDGHNPDAKIPQEGVSIINTEDYRPLRERNLSTYQLRYYFYLSFLEFDIFCTVFNLFF